MGQMLGPIFAGVFTNKYGYRLTCDMVAFSCLFLAVIFLLFTDLKNYFIKGKN